MSLIFESNKDFTIFKFEHQNNRRISQIKSKEINYGTLDYELEAFNCEFGLSFKFDPNFQKISKQSFFNLKIEFRLIPDPTPISHFRIENEIIILRLCFENKIQSSKIPQIEFSELFFKTEILKFEKICSVSFGIPQHFNQQQERVEFRLKIN